MITLGGQAARPRCPVVRVVVVHVSSSTGWVTLAVAIAGVVLSLASLAWQAFSFWRSGHRVRVGVRVGAFGLIGERPAFMEVVESRFPSQADVDAFAVQGLDTPVVITFVRNVGRFPVTVHECKWETSSGTPVYLEHSTHSDSFPRRLEAGDQCQAVFEIKVISSMFQSLARRGMESDRKIFAVAELATST
jgi:hypothetical protein